jgi:Leucine-rich repeat (LRR) protein
MDNIKLKKRIDNCFKNKKTYLDLSNLNLIKLPNKLPNFIETLRCENNKLTELPKKLPNSLIILYCGQNSLTKLSDTLPDSLQKIYCQFNRLTELPSKLPKMLSILYCKNNLLKKIETVPDYSLYCDNNVFLYNSCKLYNANCIKKFYCDFLECTNYKKNYYKFYDDAHSCYRCYDRINLSHLMMKKAATGIWKWYCVRKIINKTLKCKSLYYNNIKCKDICYLICEYL